MESNTIPGGRPAARGAAPQPDARKEDKEVDSNTLKIRKLLPSLALGVCITLLAALFNYVIYDRRIPAMAAGNRILADPGGEEADGRRRAPVLRALAGLINLSDDIVIDAMYAIRGRGDFPATRDKIAVIAIDEDSIVRRGAWPWSRRDIATLIDRASDARVVGVDLLFSEPDHTSLAHYVERFDSLYGTRLDTTGTPPETMDNDLFLADSIAGARTVLGAVLYDGRPPPQRPAGMKNNHPPEIVHPRGVAVAEEDVLLKRMQWALTDLPVLRDGDPPPVGEGFMNLFPAPNGVVRSIPAFAHVSREAFAEASPHPRRIAPSLALEVMRASMDGDGYRINLRGDKVNIPEFKDYTSNGDRYAVKSISILRGGEEIAHIPLNELAEMEIGFRRHRHDYTVYPAWEVLEGRHDGAFTDKIVVIGGTVEGVGYVISAGLPDPEVSVVEGHATMLSAMLKGDFMDSGYQDDYFWQQAAILASGMAITLAIILGDLAGGMIVSALALLGIFLANYFLFFKRGMDVGVTLPILSILAVLAVLTVANYLVVGRERRFIRCRVDILYLFS